MNIEKNKMYSRKETADILGMSMPTFDRYLARKAFPIYKRGNAKSARVFIKGEDIMNFILSWRS